MATQNLVPSRAGKYLTFQISQHYFAIEARRIRQITPGHELVPLEHSLECVVGAVLVHGRRVPVVDIRRRLSLDGVADYKQATVLLVDVEDVCGLPRLGLIVDVVSDIVDFRDHDFRDTTIQLRPNGRPYGRPKTLLRPGDLLSAEEMTSLLPVT